jgi:hypothetical protein
MLWIKLLFHFAKVGRSFLKKFPFRSSQMCQQAMITTSMKKGFPKLTLAAETIA